MKWLALCAVAVLIAGCFGSSNVTVQQDCAMAANIEACKAEKQREADAAAAAEAALVKDFRDHHPIIASVSANAATVLTYAIVPFIVGGILVIPIGYWLETHVLPWLKLRRGKRGP
jgi:hypothetical protein